MKKPFRLLVFILCVIVVSGCNSSATPVNISITYTPLISPIQPTLEITPSPNQILLEVNGEKVGFEFLQNGVSVPLSGSEEQWNVTLEPKPFALVVYGNKDLVSIMATKSEDILLPLKQASIPVVHPEGTSQGFYQNDLYLQEKPLDISVGDLSFFTQAHLPEQKAQEAVEFLKSQLGTEPLIITSTRTYLDDYPNFTIETINGNTIQNGESIMLVVFADQELPNNSQVSNGWFLVKWLVFKAEFRSNQ